MQKHLCIVIPAYNEERRIGAMLQSIYTESLRQRRYRISAIVVSESSDSTNSIVERFAKTHKGFLLLAYRRRLGKGGAVLEGFRYALEKLNPDLLGFADADGSVTARELLKLARHIESTSADGAIGSRYLEGSILSQKRSFRRQFASRFFNFEVRHFFGFGYKDTQCGGKVFTAEALRNVIGGIALTDMSFDVNLLYEMKLKGFRIDEVPIRYIVKESDSKVKVSRDLPKLTLIALGYRLRRSALGRHINKRLVDFIYDRLKRW